MKSILEELWYGNICPSESRQEATKEEKELLSRLTTHHDDLLATLNAEQKEIFRCLDNCYAELASMAEREIFVYAFRLGARFATEIMSDNFD